MTREPEWDDDTRGRALRLAEYEDNLCGCGCGQPVGIAFDKARVFKVDKATCYAGRALERVRDKDRADAKEAKRPDGWDAGLHYFVVPHDDENHQHNNDDQEASRGD